MPHHMTLAQYTAMAAVLSEIEAERMEQHARWGEQNHPDVTVLYDKDVMGAVADAAREQTEIASRVGQLSYKHILEEEWCEAMAELHDPEALRAELVQVAAVAVAWIETLDRRKGE